MAHEKYLTNNYTTNHYPGLQHGIGLGIQNYDINLHPTQGYYPDHRSQSASPFDQPAMRSSSPPTPISHQSSTRRTRSGRCMLRNDSPHSTVNRSSPGRSIRRKKTLASEKRRTPKLTAPLSVLTKDMLDVPVRDMEAWVRRPTEERTKEAEKRNGYITRPMNSFMLYRSAYAERTKMWCLHNNHQVVSSVSGESWPLEPPEVREFYNELAKIERMNHQSAHPNYKFSPSKPGAGTASNKKRTRADEDDSEPSDLDDPDWTTGNATRSKPSKRLERDTDYSVPTNIDDNSDRFRELYNHPNVFWNQPIQSNPVTALPYQPLTYAQHFYPSPMTQHRPINMLLQSEQMQDTFNAFEGSSFPANQSLIGFPGADHTELLGLHHPAVLNPAYEQQFDPLLLGYHDSGVDTIEGGNLALTQYSSAFERGSVEHRAEQSAGESLITDYRQRGWAPGSTNSTFDPVTSEFDQLWNEHELERKASLRSHHSLVTGAPTKEHFQSISEAGDRAFEHTQTS